MGVTYAVLYLRGDIMLKKPTFSVSSRGNRKFMFNSELIAIKDLVELIDQNYQNPDKLSHLIEEKFNSPSGEQLLQLLLGKKDT